MVWVAISASSGIISTLVNSTVTLGLPYISSLCCQCTQKGCLVPDDCSRLILFVKLLVWSEVHTRINSSVVSINSCHRNSIYVTQFVYDCGFQCHRECQEEEGGGGGGGCHIGNPTSVQFLTTLLKHHTYCRVQLSRCHYRNVAVTFASPSCMATLVDVSNHCSAFETLFLIAKTIARAALNAKIETISKATWRIGIVIIVLRITDGHLVLYVPSSPDTTGPKYLLHTVWQYWRIIYTQRTAHDTWQHSNCVDEAFSVVYILKSVLHSINFEWELTENVASRRSLNSQET